MKMKMMLLGATLLAASPALAQTAYTNEAAFNTATTGQSFTTQSFESTPTGTSTSLDFGDVTFSCNGTSYCPGFFGRSTQLRTDGAYSVYYATPDSAILTFTSAITAFGIDVIGLGDVGATNFFVDIGTGPLALQQNYSAAGGTVTFAGVTSNTAFTTVTFTGSQVNDGIFFDRLRYVTAAATPVVPEPATWAMMIAGFGLAGAAMRRRRTSVVFA